MGRHRRVILIVDGEPGGGPSLTYDANGNVTAYGTTTYTWNVRNQLTAVGSTPLEYDGLGRRQKRGSGNATTEFVYDGLNPVQEKKGNQVKANLVTGLGLDEYLTRIEGNTTRHLLPDALGSTLALTDTGGTVKTEYTYEPFGKTTATGQTSTNSFKYTGREDDGTGLYYYPARYYHPGLQRFMSEDPVAFGTGEFNLYSYARNQRTRLRDPLGLWTIGIGVEVQGGLLGHGGGVGVSVVRDGHGNVGVQVTVGGGGYGGAAGGSVGVEFTGTTAGTIHDLTGLGGAGQTNPVPTGIGPTVGGVAGGGYAGGTVGVAGGAGIGVGSGFVTHTWCLLGCRKSTPPPELPPFVGP